MLPTIFANDAIQIRMKKQIQASGTHTITVVHAALFNFCIHRSRKMRYTFILPVIMPYVEGS